MTKSNRSMLVAFALLAFFGIAQAQQKNVDNWSSGVGSTLSLIHI